MFLTMLVFILCARVFETKITTRHVVAQRRCKQRRLSTSSPTSFSHSRRVTFRGVLKVDAATTDLTRFNHARTIQLALSGIFPSLTKYDFLWYYFY